MSYRAKILAEVQRAAGTVEEIAGRVGMNSNCVGSQLRLLWTQGLVPRSPERVPRPGRTSPAYIYGASDAP